MKNRYIKFLKQIVEAPSPTGCEVPVADIVRARLGRIADEVRTDTMGSVHAAYLGSRHPHGAETAYVGTQARPAMAPRREAASALTFMLAAHMDEIGLMVTYISDEGFLSVAAIGGVDAAILPGMRVDVHTASGVLRGVVGRKPIHLIEPDDRKTVTPLDGLVIDLGMPAKQVKKKVRVGDAITFGVGFERFGDGMAVSRAFDDKVGVFIACRVMENLAANEDYKGNFVAAVTVQEEIGTRGAMTSAHAIFPDVALAFDVTHATDYPGIDKSKYGDIRCGKGPVIARGPNINPVVFDRLLKAAEDEGIPFQLEAEPSVTGTDARAIQVARGGIPTGLVSIPLRYMHTPTEVIDLADVEGAVRLITRFALDLDEAEGFVPGYYGPNGDIPEIPCDFDDDDDDDDTDEDAAAKEEGASADGGAGADAGGQGGASPQTGGASGNAAGQGGAAVSQQAVQANAAQQAAQVSAVQQAAQASAAAQQAQQMASGRVTGAQQAAAQQAAMQQPGVQQAGPAGSGQAIGVQAAAQGGVQSGAQNPAAQQGPIAQQAVQQAAQQAAQGAAAASQQQTTQASAAQQISQRRNLVAERLEAARRKRAASIPAPVVTIDTTEEDEEE